MKTPDAAYVGSYVFKLLELTAQRRIADLKSRAAAHQPGRARRRLQPDVRRARRPGAAPPHPARPDRGHDVRRPAMTAVSGSAPTSPVGPGERLLAWADDHRRRDRRRHPRRPLPARRRADAVGDSGGRRLGQRDRRAARQRGRHAGARTAPSTLVPIDEPGRLLELVRERVTASVVFQRHVAIDGRRGVRVIARRAPGTAAPRGHLGLRVRRGRSTPTTRSSGWPPPRRSRRLATSSASPEGSRFQTRWRPLLTYPRTIPCSSVGRALDC